MTAVWESSSHKGNALLLMLTIADHASDDGTHAYPSVRRLAKRTRMSERSVQRMIQECEASGELLVNRPDVREHRPNYYTIRLDRLPMGDTTVTHAKLAPMSKRPAMSDSVVTRTVPLEPSEDRGTKEEADTLWQETLAWLRPTMNARNWRLTFEHSAALGFDGNVLVVQVRDQHALKEIQARYGPLVGQVLGEQKVRFESG